MREVQLRDGNGARDLMLMLGLIEKKDKSGMATLLATTLVWSCLEKCIRA